MQTVTTTPTFEMQAKRCGLTEDELEFIVWTIAGNPQSGAIMPGTGGARKVRFAGRGHGKSGGYRTIHYFAGADVPVFLLGIYGKGEKGNLTKAECNALAALMPQLAEAYRPKSRKET